jgi:hypothetical protein
VKETRARILEANSLAELLSVSFDAFESIRIRARSCEDREPALFAAFMATADAAVDGREAIVAAPALGPAGPDAVPADPSGAGISVTEAADSLAALGALLSEHLTRAAARTSEPGDRVACQEAARAASRVHDLMARRRT